MKKILITGHKGTIGQILMRGLHNRYSVRGADLPEFDLVDPESVAQALTPAPDTVIHLAWDVHAENFRNGRYDARNSEMFFNIFQQAAAKGVKRVIVASSIHADSKVLRTAQGNPLPDSPYGANKVFMETLGRVYACSGLEVICIRFGGVNASDTIDPTEEAFAQVWLSHRDCCSLIHRCIDADYFPDNFTVVTAVSNNPGRYHDTSNPFGWIPVDSSKNQETSAAVTLYA
jgi:NAD+ dependent glucose-6-phosphate dehydrogenase